VYGSVQRRDLKKKNCGHRLGIQKHEHIHIGDYSLTELVVDEQTRPSSCTELLPCRVRVIRRYIFIFWDGRVGFETRGSRGRGQGE
jgi:hypothetical protein